MTLATNSNVDTGVSAETLNVLTQAARTTPAMVQPTAIVVSIPKGHSLPIAPKGVSVDPFKLPNIGYVADIGKATKAFVAAVAKCEAARDAHALTAAAHALKFVGEIHSAMPDYAGYMKVQAEIKAACALGFHMQPMTIVKAYRVALVRTFDAELPVSETPAAQAKAKARAKAKASKANKGKAKGTPEVKPAAEHEVIGQCIAKYGAAAVLVELAKILATEKQTLADAHTIMEVAKHYAGK